MYGPAVRVSAEDREQLGMLIQSYVRAKRVDSHDTARAGQLGERLGRRLRDRVDMLGLDGARLLDSPPQQVLQMLAALEQQALLEDAGITTTVADAQARRDGSGPGQVKKAWR